MATLSTARQKGRRAARAVARTTVADSMRQDIPGQGVFLVASIGDYPNMSVPPPNPDLKDLYLVPGTPIAIDEGWLSSPLLIRDFRNGRIKLEYRDSLPDVGQVDPDPATVEGLPPQMRLMVRTIAESPFTAQYRDMLSLGNQIKRTGLPVKNSRVTKRWLQGEYAVFLRAVQTFEGEKRARPEILELVAAQLAKIEAL